MVTCPTLAHTGRLPAAGSFCRSNSTVAQSALRSEIVARTPARLSGSAARLAPPLSDAGIASRKASGTDAFQVADP